MKSHTLVCLYFLSISLVYAQQPDVFDEAQTNQSNIRATITNHGGIGNAFTGSFNIEGFSSFEFPANSGVEHIFDGGLWIGGITGGQIAVSTGAVDDSRGYSPGKSGFEFTSKTELSQSSSLRDDPTFNPLAISHQDIFSTFVDTAISITNPNGQIIISQHERPLGVEIDFRALNWNFSFANFFVILNFSIKNVSRQPIDSIFVGYWADGVVRNINLTAPFTGGSAFFNKGGNGFIDSLAMAYEFDAAGDVGFTDSYVAIKYLGANQFGGCPSSPNFKVHYNSWQFLNATDPLLFFPTNDFQRYSKLNNGLNFLPAWENIQRSINDANNRSNLVSVGPFSTLMPGESIDIAFAIVCAKKDDDGNPTSANTPEQRESLLRNAGWAQTAYNGEDANGNCILDFGEDLNGDGILTRFVLPTPPDPPITRIVAKDKSIEVYWADNAEFSIDAISKEMDFEGYRVYKTKVGFDVQNTQDIENDLNRIGEWDIPGNVKFFDVGFDGIMLEEPVTFPGDTNEYVYKYVFDNIANGWQHVVAVSAFDRGDEVNNVPPLESSPLRSLQRVFAGKPANDGFVNGDPFVYPNPYYAAADWEGNSRFEKDRKLIFANLPANCQVRIYTLAGDLVDSFEHDASTYSGSDISWFDTYSDPEKTTFSGGEHAWDLLSSNTQIIARGLYLFVVEEKESGDKFRGKFVIIK